MRIELIKGADLDAGLIQNWRSLQDAAPTLASPYYAPEYTQAVVTERDDVEVAVIEDGGDIAALFAFQRETPRQAGPVGGGLCDYHGLVAKRDFRCDPADLLRACNLLTWDFDHLPVSQTSFQRFHRSMAPSPIMDLSAGFDAYASSCKAVKAERRKLRRLEREVGPLRFVAHDADIALFSQILAWKGQQYVATGHSDGLLIPWVRGVLERIQATQEEGFAGTVSLLYAGDRLVAGHFGMRSRTVWHWWYPAYDPEMSRYSPGLVLLIKMAEHASQLGLSIIDFGKGSELYKQRFKNGEIMLAAGAVEAPSLLSLRRQVRRASRNAIVGSPMEGLVRRALRRPKRA